MKFLYVLVCLICSMSVFAKECASDVDKFKNDIAALDNRYQNVLASEIEAYFKTNNVVRISGETIYGLFMREDAFADTRVDRLQSMARKIQAISRRDCVELLAVYRENLAVRERNWKRIAELVSS